MIDLTRSPIAGPAWQTVDADPGCDWAKDPQGAVEAPPDDDREPRPDARWAPAARRTGVGAAVAPRVVRLPDGSYRLYYTQLLARPGTSLGALDFATATARILSAVSADGMAWTPEPGVRLSAAAGGAGGYRVIAGDIAPIGAVGGRWRMYYECADGPRLDASRILSAVSVDGGLSWVPEPGVRLGAPGRSFFTPRVLLLADGGLRLFCGERGRGIISARADARGLDFREEPGVRIASDGPYDATTAFAPEVLRLPGGGLLMYYAGYETDARAHILRATSAEGLEWRKDPGPVLSPTPGGWDAAKCSEMSVFACPGTPGGRPRHRLVYEGCDGTAAGRRGVWRILGATAA